MNTVKPWYLSKTIWAVAAVVLSTATPEVQQFVAAHPGWCGTGVGILFGILRFVTKTGIGISGGDVPVTDTATDKVQIAQ